MIYLDSQSSDYSIIRYPAGELQVRLSSKQVEALPYLEKERIRAEIKSAEDFLVLALLVDAIRGLNATIRLHLKLAYLPYARADRRFVPGDCHGLNTFCQLLNGLRFQSVVCLDPHPVLNIPLNNLIRQEASEYIQSAIIDFASRQETQRITVLLPDAGAHTRYAEQIPLELVCNTRRIVTSILACTKVRDVTTGTLTKFIVPPFEGPAIVIDDICDGGGTFLGIAKQVPERPLGLYTTHAIYSKGVTDLLNYYEHLYCTDSFGRMPLNERITQYRINRSL